MYIRFVSLLRHFWENLLVCSSRESHLNEITHPLVIHILLMVPIQRNPFHPSVEAFRRVLRTILRWKRIFISCCRFARGSSYSYINSCSEPLRERGGKKLELFCTHVENSTPLYYINLQIFAKYERWKKIETSKEVIEENRQKIFFIWIFNNSWDIVPVKICLRYTLLLPPLPPPLLLSLSLSVHVFLLYDLTAILFCG